jgi:FADH2 O2-dependent halogenase
MKSGNKRVIIVGGGPAGSAVGAYLSMAGIPNTIIEKEIHPRPHVGESLVPITTRYLRELGVIPMIDNDGTVRKFGAAWHPPSGSNIASIQFRKFPQKGVTQEYSYHVDRAKFDLMLLKRAEELGSKIYQGLHVREVLFEDGWARGVSCAIGDKTVELEAPVIVDATGRNTLLGQQLKLKKNDPIFNQFAVHGWFEGVRRGLTDPETADYIHIYFLQGSERGWAWQIPITDEVTSIGIVTEKRVFRSAKKDYDAWFQEQVANHPTLTEVMQGTKQVRDFEAEGDYSYSLKDFAGNGFIMVGDAARFVDPIFSSGISVALASASLASEAICRAFDNGDVGHGAFQAYEKKLRSGVEIWYEFIRLYYKLLPIFTHFIQDQEYREELLTLLSGDVYDRKDAPVLRRMREYIKTVESSGNHVFKNALTSMPID